MRRKKKYIKVKSSDPSDLKFLQVESEKKGDKNNWPLEGSTFVSRSPSLFWTNEMNGTLDDKKKNT